MNNMAINEISFGLAFGTNKQENKKALDILIEHDVPFHAFYVDQYLPSLDVPPRALIGAEEIIAQAPLIGEHLAKRALAAVII